MKLREHRGGLTDHIVFGTDDNLFKCVHCGQTYKPALPAPIDIFVAMTNAFIKMHENCKSNHETA